MSRIKTIYYALNYIKNKSVASMAYGDWARLVRDDGAITELAELPQAIANPKLEASTLVSVASGIAVPDPGMDVLRYDRKDDPYFINLDHYKIIENLQEHEIYPEVLHVAGMADSAELRYEFQNNIYVIKEPPNNNHWLEDFPQHVLKAKMKFDL
ncbi:hypothetical protein JIN77_08575 [Verrucomicrobiaceae bacterium R5-34]|nr:hypothetical protein [Verrucomicrobiaceae bacterium R5-34]